MWGFEIILRTPLTVTRRLLQTWDNPLAGLPLLANHLVSHALPMATLSMALALIAYYLRRKGEEPIDLWNAFVVAGYCFTPHALLVALSSVVGHSIWDAPWLLHHDSPSSFNSDIQWLMGGPVVLLYAWFAMGSRQTAFQLPKPRLFRIGVLILVPAALLLTARFTEVHFDEARPLTSGDVLPALTLYDSQGDPRRVENAENKVLLIDVWATWCGPCVASMPHLEALHRRFSGDEFELISMNVEPGRVSHVLEFAKKLGLSFPIYFDRGRARQLLTVDLYPTVVLVNQHGNVHKVYSGTVSMLSLEKDVEKLLAKKR